VDDGVGCVAESSSAGVDTAVEESASGESGVVTTATPPRKPTVSGAGAGAADKTSGRGGEFEVPFVEKYRPLVVSLRSVVKVCCVLLTDVLLPVLRSLMTLLGTKRRLIV
jgi:hypothetical protein